MNTENPTGTNLWWKGAETHTLSHAHTNNLGHDDT